MFIDSHCHLDRIDLKDFHGDFQQLISQIQSQDVERMLCVSINLDDYPAMLEQVLPYEQVDVSVGIHPSDARDHATDLETLISRGQHPRVVAIGETGLDYYYSADSKPEQQASFRTHIQAARQLQKPVIIHSRDAREDTLAIMAQEQIQDCGAVLHCFTENWDMARRALEMGVYISFSGIVTFKTAEALREVASKVADDRFLIETDSPYLAPVPHRGKQNYPGWVGHVAECLAEVRGSSIEIIARQSRENYLRLFQPR